MRYLSAEPVHVMELQSQQEVADGRWGALVTFMGVVRADQEAGGVVRALFYETFPEMAEAQIDRIVSEVHRRRPGTRVWVRHRYGMVPAGDASLVAVAAAAHRAEAYAACQELVDAIKQDVPIWKRIHYDDGSARWEMGAIDAHV